jgi:hypothetical protein
MTFIKYALWISSIVFISPLSAEITLDGKINEQERL